MAGLIVYPLGAVVGLLLSAWAWERAASNAPAPSPSQRHAIFLGCLAGMVVGAKLGFVFAEGTSIIADDALTWSTRALALVRGKTVTGGLLGAYAGVEIAKRRVGYTLPTGDRFAVLAPLSLALAAAWTVRDAHGIARWPAVPLEFAFNLAFLAWVCRWIARRPDALRGQLFHVYLMAYGVFRFAHEFMRATPRWVGPWSGYHLLALAVFSLGVGGFVLRARALPPPALVRRV